MIKASFMEVIQLHERKWGEQTYPGRPTLADIMQGHIVAVWMFKGRFMLSVHHTAQQVNEIVLDKLTNEGQTANWKLGALFVNKQQLDFTLRLMETKPPLPQTKPLQPIKTDREHLDHHPNLKWGTLLPGRDVKMLPGRKAIILQRRFGK